MTLLHPDETQPDLAVSHKGAGGADLTESSANGPLGTTHRECLCLFECDCACLSVSVVAPDECDSAVSCISSTRDA